MAVKEGSRLADQHLIFFPGRMHHAAAVKQGVDMFQHGCATAKLRHAVAVVQIVQHPGVDLRGVVFVLVVFIEVQQQINMQGVIGGFTVLTRNRI